MEYRFGAFTLDGHRGELRDGETAIAVEPRAFSLLTHMVENHGRLVTKDELVEAVWDGRIVSDAAIATAIKAVRRALDDDQTLLRTIRGRGFRFDAEIERHEAPPAAVALPTPPDKPSSMAIFDRPSVLVVAFDCISTEGWDSALALGLCQEVRLNLSYWRWFPVIGPEALGFRTASEIDLYAKAREIGASYALTGAVRSMGERVRVNVSLSAIETGTSIWSHHFDGTIEDLFAFEETVSRAIVAQIEPEISRANSQRLAKAQPADLTAWQLLLQAGEAERRGGEGYGTREANDIQKALLTRALEKDRAMARAWAWLAKCYWREVIMGWAEDREAALDASLAASETALEINPTNWEARCFRGIVLVFGRREFVESEFHAREAVRLNPSDATARHGLGCVLENVGRTEEALGHLETVFRLNPNHSNSAGVLGDIVTCQMLLGRDEDARQSALRLMALAPNYSRGLQRAAAALAQAGDMERAREAVRRLRAAQPDFDEGYVRMTYPFQSEETLEHFVEMIRVAGGYDVAS